jgi:hypothetical protein
MAVRASSAPRRLAACCACDAMPRASSPDPSIGTATQAPSISLADIVLRVSQSAACACCDRGAVFAHPMRVFRAGDEHGVCGNDALAQLCHRGESGGVQVGIEERKARETREQLDSHRGRSHCCGGSQHGMIDRCGPQTAAQSQHSTRMSHARKGMLIHSAPAESARDGSARAGGLRRRPGCRPRRAGIGRLSLPLPARSP